TRSPDRSSLISDQQAISVRTAGSPTRAGCPGGQEVAALSYHRFKHQDISVPINVPVSRLPTGGDIRGRQYSGLDSRTPLAERYKPRPASPRVALRRPAVPATG